MSSPKFLAVASPIVSTVAFSPFLTQINGKDAESQVPQELHEKKDLCGGFRIVPTDNGEPNNEKGMLNARLSEFGFGAPKEKICLQSGLNNMETANQDTINIVNGGCEKHDEVSGDGGKRLLSGEPVRITEADKKAGRLVAFLECIKLVKTLTLKSTGEEGLKHSVIGQF